MSKKKKGIKEMEKIRLKDQTEINVEGGMTANHFEAVVVGYDGMKNLYDSLTDDNLSEFQVVNDAGLVCATLKNKRVSAKRTFETIEGTGNFRVTVKLEDVDVRELQVGQALANIDYLVMMSEM